MIRILLVLEVLLLGAGFLVDQPFLGAALGAAATYGLLAYRHPDLAWAGVFLAFPFSVERLLPGGSALHLPTEPMIGIALLAWTLRVLAKEPIRLPGSPLHTPLAVLAVTTLLATIAGPYPLLGIKGWLIAATYVLFGYVTCFVTWRDPSRLERLAPWIVGAAALWGLYGSLRVLMEGVSLRSAYGAARPFFAEHGAYAAYLAMILPLGFLLALERRGTARWLYASATLAMGLGIALSFTRASWVGLAIVLPSAAALWALRRRSLRPAALVGGIALAGVLVLSISGAREDLARHAGSITAPHDVSNLERINRWMAAVEMARDRPWLGVGYAAYPVVYPEYRRKVFLTELAHQNMGPHSELFRLLAETGIPGLLAACWLLGTACVLGFHVVRRSADPSAAALALAILAGLGTYAIHGLFRTYIDLEKVAVPFWAGLGALAGMARTLERRP